MTMAEIPTHCPKINNRYFLFNFIILAQSVIPAKAGIFAATAALVDSPPTVDATIRRWTHHDIPAPQSLVIPWSQVPGHSRESGNLVHFLILSPRHSSLSDKA